MDVSRTAESGIFPGMTDQSRRYFLFIFPSVVSYHHTGAFNEVINSRCMFLILSLPGFMAYL